MQGYAAHYVARICMGFKCSPEGDACVFLVCHCRIHQESTDLTTNLWERFQRGTKGLDCRNFRNHSYGCFGAHFCSDLVIVN